MQHSKSHISALAVSVAHEHGLSIGARVTPAPQTWRTSWRGNILAATTVGHVSGGSHLRVPSAAWVAGHSGTWPGYALCRAEAAMIFPSAASDARLCAVQAPRPPSHSRLTLAPPCATTCRMRNALCPALQVAATRVLNARLFRTCTPYRERGRSLPSIHP